MREQITLEQARRLFVYCPETGLMTWTMEASRAVAGKRAGSARPGGRRQVKIGRQMYLEHRVAWLLTTGRWPTLFVDHINGDPADNRWCNLREVDHSTNLENQRRARSDNRLGLLGVRRTKSNRYDARIWIKGKPRSLGVFDTAEAASAAYIAAKRRLHVGCTI